MIDKNFLINTAGDFNINISMQEADVFNKYAEILIFWNSKMNLTRITSPEDIVIKHFIDSLLLINFLDIPQKSSFVDIGAGAGFPSVPIKIIRNDLKITQIDSLLKRVNFLNTLNRELNLGNKVYHLRAEEGSRDFYHRESYGFAVARAVANLTILSEYLIPYVKLNGYFLALKGGDIENEINDASTIINVLGGRLENVENYKLPDGSNRSLVIVKKISQTPIEYPRITSKILKSNNK